ncbi:MAG: MFS transporter [Gammaproteobacteria bacterium]|nr:MFS transporter [Gammaproteobacteria bacterium]NDE86523.1 MFS transporter [Gammaproteobacteria bacterium]
MNSSREPGFPAPAVAQRVTIALMVAYVFSYVDRQILSMLVGPIRTDLGLSDTEVSLLHGLAFAICYTVLGVWPIGRWADTGNRRNIVAGGLFLWSLMTALCGRATSYLGLFAARVGVGVGEAALTPTAYSMIADLYPPRQRSRALALFSVGIYFGIGSAVMITGALVAMIAAAEVMHWPLIGEVRPWQLPFLILGPLGMLVTIWMLRIPEPARQTAVPAATRFVDVMHWMRQEWRFYLMHTFGVSMLTLIFNGVAFWIPAHFMRVHGFGPIDVAFSYGPIMLIAGAAGIMAGGTLADRWRAAGKQDAELRVLLMSAILLAPLVALTFSVDDPRLALAMLIPTLFCSSFPFAAASAALQLVTPGPLRARASALYLLVINLTGIGIGATAMSMVSDYVLQDERRIGDGVIWVTAVAAPLAALLIGLARRAYRGLAARGC